MFDKLHTAVSAHRLQVLLALALFVVAIGGYGAWRWPTLFGPSQDASRVVVSGNIEAHESVLSVTQVQAPIVYLPFDEGAYVKRDTVLARLDDRLYREQTEIDRTDLDVATAQISANESTLTAAHNSVVSDQFDLAEKQLDLARDETLVKNNAIAVQARDLAFTAERQSATTLAHDQALVAVARNNIALARANQAAADAKLKLDQVRANGNAGRWSNSSPPPSPRSK
ncbi:hypothetical protein [Paraburkholderia sp. BCC1885]|uniref:hypothetical protein n=1 Tax=Paraburkholderia sp. BCC1885 TaxID=2562669 RepID=UPI0021B1D4E5|nr:hypothetical protein [Paraburkholderia sp. BCC1885]